MKLLFKRVPLLLIPMEEPRGPSVHPTPEPLRFMRIPGASLMDFLNRTGMVILLICLSMSSVMANQNRPELCG